MAPVGNVPAAIPTTYIESGTVASEISGASVAPIIEPVAKITAEFAPVSACAAASRTTLDRARASLAISSLAVTSIIGHFRPGRGRRRSASLIPTTMKGGVRAINRCKRACAIHRRSGGIRAPEYQGQIVGGHLGDLDQFQAGTAGKLLQILDIAHAPVGIALAKT